MTKQIESKQKLIKGQIIQSSTHKVLVVSVYYSAASDLFKATIRVLK